LAARLIQACMALATRNELSPRISKDGPVRCAGWVDAHVAWLNLQISSSNASISRPTTGTEGDGFRVGWTEREGPPVSAPQRRGFGTTVIEVMTERSVAGAVNLDYAPSGLAWRLTCPAANALESQP
jgi:hypothetical protein